MSTQNSYEGNLGVGGKFRKQSQRRSKPYDRPPPPPPQTGGGSNNGWISKLVDPAHRLITASAHRLFGSVFQKRLTQPPPPEPQETSQEVMDKYQDAVSLAKIVSPGVQDAIIEGSEKNFSNRGGITELEQIFKQKTFTRSEVERLTALLHSKTVDMPVEDEERRSRAFASSQGKEKFNDTPRPQKQNGEELRLTSTPAVRSVLDEDVASPAELAKAYMGSKTSKVSPSKLGLRSQAMKDDPNMLGMQHFPQNSSRMALMPRFAPNAGVPSNGIITSRPRVRSALYSMARSPYAMLNSVSASKRAGYTFDTDAGPSSSSSSQLPTWNDSKVSTSKQGSLKRRSSVLENDIGSVGPIRRTRQKYNLLTSRKLSQQPASGSFHSVPRLASGVDALHNSSAVSKSHLFSDPVDNVFKVLREDGDISTAVPYSTPVSLKSSEMATKILQQLDKLVSPKEKSSPTEMPQSMLNESVKDVVQCATADTARIKSFANHPLENQASQRSAHEVTSELEDHSNHNDVMTVSERDSKAVLTDKATKKSHFAAHDIEPSHNLEFSDGTMAAKPSAGFALPSVSSSSANPVTSSSQLISMKGSSTGNSLFGFGNKPGMHDKPNAMSSPSNTFGDKIASPKEANISPITIEANGASSNCSNSVTGIAGPKASASSITGSVENNNKSEEIGDNKKKMSSKLINRTSESVFPSLVSQSTSNAGVSPFAASVNGLLGTASSSPPVSSLFSHSGTIQNASSSLISTASAPAFTTSSSSNNDNASGFNSSSSNSIPASSVSAFPAVPIFKFASQTPTHSDAELGAETRSSASFDKPSGSPFRSTPTVADAGSSIFGFTAQPTESSVNLSQGSTTFSFGSAVATSASSGSATSSQSMQSQFGLSASVPSFSFGGNSGLSSSSSLSGSSASGAKTLNAGNPFGHSCGSFLDANSVSSSSSTFDKAAASPQPAESPFVGSVFSSSTGFSFGQSSATASTTELTGSSSTAPTAFASSTGSSIFSFTSSMPSTSLQPAFKSTNSAAAFCSEPLTSNDQMIMEDGMAEETVQASAPTPSTSIFGQQTISSQPPAFVFGSPAPSFPSPFQFGSQQSTSTPQNSGPFQPSGSLGFNAGGGSFSLGSGGGEKSKRKIVRVKRTRK